MKVRYRKPITAKSAPKILKAVRKELASCRCTKLISNIINPVCGVIFTVFMAMAGALHFGMVADSDMVTAANKIRLYRKLCEKASDVLPKIKDLGSLTPRDLCLVYCAVLVILFAVVITVAVRLIYHPKVKTDEEEYSDAELAKILHAEAQEMCAKDKDRYSDRWCNYAALALFIIGLVFFWRFLSVYGMPTKFMEAYPWVFYLLFFTAVALFAAHLLDTIIVWVCGLSNKYGASSIMKDTYDYWCSVDPEENARRWNGAMGVALEDLTRNSDYQNDGFSYAMKAISGTHKLAMLQALTDNDALGYEEFTQMFANIPEKAVSEKLDELVELGLANCLNAENGKKNGVYSLTESGTALMKNVNNLSSWGEKQLKKDKKTQD